MFRENNIFPLLIKWLRGPDLTCGP